MKLSLPFKLAALTGLLVSLAVPAAPQESDESPKRTEVRLSAHLAQGAADGASPRLRIKATPYSGQSQGPPSIEFLHSSRGELSLVPGRWVLEAEVDGFWTPPVQLEVGSEPIARELVLWPTGFLEGSFSTFSKSEQPPSEILLFFRPEPTKTAAKKGPPPGRLRCPVNEDLVFRCEPPAGKMDLRIVVQGFVPLFAWSIDFRAGENKNLGSTQLRRGSSVLGWVRTEEGNAASEAELELRPFGGETLRVSAKRQRIKERHRRVKTNGKGFFQIDDLPPGAYVLEARLEPYATATTTVRITSDQVTEVTNPPLVLQRPKILTSFVNPPVDPWEQPWTLELQRLDRKSSQVLDTVRESVGSDGVCEIKGLSPAFYSVKLISSRGDSWATAPVEIKTDNFTLELGVQIVDVRGTVQLGEEPLAADLFFGGRFGAVRLATQSNEEGRFQLYLPRQGSWPVSVQAADPSVSRDFGKIEVKVKASSTVARVDLYLDHTRLSGRIVDVLQNAVEGALVNFSPSQSDSSQIIQKRSDSNGNFEFQGLSVGRGLVSAEAAGRLYSQPQTVEILKKGEEQESLTLTVEEQVRIEGYIGSSLGAVPGVRIKATPALQPYLGVGTVTTDTQGRFQLYISPAANEIHLAVSPPGFAFRMLRLPVPEDSRLALGVEQDHASLTIEINPPIDWTDTRGPKVYLLHRGGVEPLTVLLGWAQMQGVHPDSSSTFEIPALEPGSYTACLASSQERPGLELGVLPSKRCDTVQLLPNGEGVLRLSGSKAESATTRE